MTWNSLSATVSFWSFLKLPEQLFISTDASEEQNDMATSDKFSTSSKTEWWITYVSRGLIEDYCKFFPIF